MLILYIKMIDFFLRQKYLYIYIYKISFYYNNYYCLCYINYYFIILKILNLLILHFLIKL